MEPRRKWAESDSDDDIDDQPDNTIGENIITSLKAVETPAAKPIKTKKKKPKPEEPEEKIDPNLVTKIVKESSKPENKNLRPDGTTASKKEKKEKELEELNKLLAELGAVSNEPQGEATGTSNKDDDKKEENKAQGKGKKSKSNKKEIFENVRSEIAARNDKSKKNKKKDKFHNY